MRRVVVTGIGLVTALGATVKETWEAMLAGKDGISEITSFDTSRYKVHRACEVKKLNFNGHIITKKPFTVYDCLLASAREALEDSGLDGYEPLRPPLQQEPSILHQNLRRLLPPPHPFRDARTPPRDMRLKNSS